MLEENNLDLNSTWVGLFSVVSPHFSKIPEASLPASLADISVTLVTLRLRRRLLRFITVAEQGNRRRARKPSQGGAAQGVARTAQGQGQGQGGCKLLARAEV